MLGGLQGCLSTSKAARWTSSRPLLCEWFLLRGFLTSPSVTSKLDGFAALFLNEKIAYIKNNFSSIRYVFIQTVTNKKSIPHSSLFFSFSFFIRLLRLRRVLSLMPRITHMAGLSNPIRIRQHSSTSVSSSDG